jgi:hypothetical protein
MVQVTTRDREWAQDLYGAADLGDARRTARLVAMAAGALAQPAGRITQVFTGAAREGAYDFLEHPANDVRAIARAQYNDALRACRGDPFAWVPLDITDLQVVDTQKVKGTGRIGSDRRPTRGFEVMTALAIRPDGVLAGVCGQAWWARSETRVTDCHNRPMDDKETRWWGLCCGRVAARFATDAPGTRPWFLMDRGADIAEFLLEQVGAERLWTVRGKHDRRVYDPLHTHVREQLAASAPLGVYAIQVAKTKTEPARTAWVELRARPLTLRLVKRLEDREFAVAAWAVEVREPSPPAGVEALDWLLYTSYPVEDFGDACLVAYGYSVRARIEEYHRIWKSGGCDVQTQQLRSAKAIETWSRLLSSVAVRLIQIRDTAREHPTTPATDLFTAAEIEATLVLRQPHDHAPGTVPTVVRMVRWIAELGGYTGRASGGPPGVTNLERGWEKVQIALLTLANSRKRG